MLKKIIFQNGCQKYKQKHLTQQAFDVCSYHFSHIHNAGIAHV